MIKTALKFFLIAIFSLYCFLLQGCIIAGALVGYHIHKQMKAKKLAQITPEQRKAYDKYVLTMQKQNAKKRQMGLKEDKVMSLEDYVDAMNAQIKTPTSSSKK